MKSSSNFLKKTKTILNIPVHFVNKKQTLEIIEQWIDQTKTKNSKVSKNNFEIQTSNLSINKPTSVAKHIVTAYSEFFVHAQKDIGFLRILQNADLVIPDGVSVLGALYYFNQIKKEISSGRQINESFKLRTGFQAGLSIFRGKVGETVTGVSLVKEIFKLAPQHNWKIFLLGGFGNTAKKLKSQITKENKKNSKLIMSHSGVPNLKTATPLEHQKTIQFINQFHPDILLVAYGPVKQEKWIAKYKNQLKTSVVIGVGGTFDELTGKIPSAPKFFKNHGLKWLWRLITQPKRIKRIFSAVVIFPLLVWKQKTFLISHS